MKKTALLLFTIVLFISCKQESKDELINSSEESFLTDSIGIADSDIELTPEEKYLSDNGFKIDAGFSESQFKEFKRAIESGLFKDESFCMVYKIALNLEGADLKKYLSKYKKIPAFETLLFMYGPRVCDMSTSSIQSSSMYVNTDENANPCVISEDFIKLDLTNPATADFSYFDCTNEKNNDGSYTVLRKVSAKNSLGVEKEYIYKVKIGFKGGNWVDESNWDLISIQSEEYK
jgi:hypothetical protein